MCNTRPTRQHAHTQENEVLTSRIGRLRQGVAPSNAPIAPPTDKPQLLNPAASGEGQQTTVKKRPQVDKKGKSTETEVAPKRMKSDHIPIRTWTNTHMRPLHADLGEWADCKCKKDLHTKERDCARALKGFDIDSERAILAAAASGGLVELAANLAFDETDLQINMVWTKRVSEAATALLISVTTERSLACRV